MALITSTLAERIAEGILSTHGGEILSILIIDEKGGGNTLASKSNESFKKTFGVFQEGPAYGGTLAITALSIANEAREIAGEAKAIVTTYEKCKMMLLPMPSYEIVVGVVLERGVVADEDKLANYIESLIADNASGAGSNNNGTTTTTATT
jgi:hypothetical protein